MRSLPTPPATTGSCALLPLTAEEQARYPPGTALQGKAGLDGAVRAMLAHPVVGAGGPAFHQHRVWHITARVEVPALGGLLVGQLLHPQAAELLGGGPRPPRF